VLRFVHEYRRRSAVVKGVLNRLLKLIARISSWPRRVPPVALALSLTPMWSELVFNERFLHLHEHPLKVVAPLEIAVIRRNRFQAHEWNPARIRRQDVGQPLGQHLFDFPPQCGFPDARRPNDKDQ
jgi:hypothetical protein